MLIVDITMTVFM